MQPAHRGACLEAVATIAESRFMSAQVLQEDSVGQSRYRAAVIEILAFAVDKLNEKGTLPAHIREISANQINLQPSTLTL